MGTEGERGLPTVTTSKTYVLALGFATTVAAWGAAYFGRLPALMAPSWLIGVAMLVCLLGGGFAAGRLVPDHPQAGALVGLLSSALNMLILGSLLSSTHSHRIAPTELLWVPGSLLLGAVVGGIGGLLGRLGEHRRGAEPYWPALLAKVAAAATFLLVIAGGLVTSNEAGLAVVDWPDSFGYNMFLYPLSRMTGGIYYEHAHRLFGSLVGLTTLVLAIVLWRVETRRWVKRLAAVAVVFVIVQGVLGGLRVTGHFTMSSSPTQTHPDLTLAVVHGISGQLFLALMVALAVVVSRFWKNAGPAASVPASRTDRTLLGLLLGALLVQLVLGALQRHLSWGLWYHVGMAVVVFALGITAGVRGRRLLAMFRPLGELSDALVLVVTIQVILGVAALIATGGVAVQGNPDVAAVSAATAHQACGALLLSLVVALNLWTRRLTTVESET